LSGQGWIRRVKRDTVEHGNERSENYVERCEDSFSEDDMASEVPGGPQCLHALLFEPVGTLALLLSHARMLPSAGSTASASAAHLSRLNHTAYRPPVYASQPGLPQDHATLDSSCQPSAHRRVNSQAPQKRGPRTIPFFCLLSSSSTYEISFFVASSPPSFSVLL